MILNEEIINITQNALEKIISLQNAKGGDYCLRISIKQGGCSGLTYAMDFENINDVQSNDKMMNYGLLNIVCDPKSLLYIYGLSLDYEESLIGGGFHFYNPNAAQTCGCGKSFTI